MTTSEETQPSKSVRALAMLERLRPSKKERVEGFILGGNE
jgi:hypothetical protein